MTRLYLDLDGVLHPKVYGDPYLAEEKGWFKTCLDGAKVFWPPSHFSCLPALVEILRPFPTVDIYLHSTWRYMWDENRPKDLEIWLGELGPQFKGFVPRFIGGSRFEVVTSHMAYDGYRGPWVAIDDEDDGFSSNGAPFIHTVSDFGLRDSDLEKLKILLSR